jgi:hypothetical protein
MSFNPHELATLLFESGIPAEIKSAIVNDFLPKMTVQDIQDLFEILKIEQKEKNKYTEKLKKQLGEMKAKIIQK